MSPARHRWIRIEALVLVPPAAVGFVLAMSALLVDPPNVNERRFVLGMAILGLCCVRLVVLAVEVIRGLDDTP